MSEAKYTVKNFVEIANRKINPDVTTLAGIEDFLVGWYCFTYGTTERDDKLQDMTLEELMVLYQMHRIKDDPNYYRDQTDESIQTYEDWLKQEMGEEYVTEEENIKAIEEHDKEYTKKIREKFPDRVDTDFSMLHKKD